MLIQMPARHTVRKILGHATLLLAATCAPLFASPDEDPFGDLRNRPVPAAGIAAPGALMHVQPVAGPARPAAPAPVPVLPAVPALPARPSPPPEPKPAPLSDEQLRVLGTCEKETMRKFLAAWENTAGDTARRAQLRNALDTYGVRRTLGGLGVLVGAGAFAGGGLGAYFTMGAGFAAAAAGAATGAVLVGGVAYLFYKGALVRNARRQFESELAKIGVPR